MKYSLNLQDINASKNINLHGIIARSSLLKRSTVFRREEDISHHDLSAALTSWSRLSNDGVLRKFVLGKYKLVGFGRFGRFLFSLKREFNSLRLPTGVGAFKIVLKGKLGGYGNARRKKVVFEKSDHSKVYNTHTQTSFLINTPSGVNSVTVFIKHNH